MDTYVYFILFGDFSDTTIITNRLGIHPTEFWYKGDPSKSKQAAKYSAWMLSSARSKEYLFVTDLVNEVVNKLFDKIDVINELKKEYQLESFLEIVLYVDINEEQSTPSLGHDLRTIEFLYRTTTETDIDMYLFDSRDEMLDTNSLR